MSSTNEGNLVTIRQTGVKDIRRALHGLEERALERALVEVRRAVDGGRPSTIMRCFTPP